MPARNRIILDGESLTIEALVAAARDPRIAVACSAAALRRVRKGEEKIAAIVERYRAARRDGASPVLDYGVTTGFGEFKRIPIAPDKLEELQTHIVLSHAAGVGVNANLRDLSNYYPAEVVRAALLLRINAFLKGFSGVSVELVDRLTALFNAGIVPLVPLRGSVGSSGDLCPLAHLALILFERGRALTWFYRVTEPWQTHAHPQLNFGGTPRRQPCPVLPATSLEIPPHRLSFKEGIALTNGATFSTGMLALAVYDAGQLTQAADIALTMSLEAARGCARAFDARIHKARGQQGQVECAANVRTLAAGSRLVETTAEVQDPYSLRCGPAVHGASRDAVAWARAIVSPELNAASDNPLFFDGEPGWDNTFRDNWKNRFDAAGIRDAGYRGSERLSFSTGNFHGQPIGLAADFLAIALAELADISERRCQLLLDSKHNRGLPANLIADAGLNSGMMIAQYCAAGLVSENKVFSHPASVDSIPTSANSEDHNAMATIAALKLRHVLAMTRFTLGIELMVAAQGVEWAALMVHRVWPAREASSAAPATPSRRRTSEPRKAPNQALDGALDTYLQAHARRAQNMSSGDAAALFATAERELFQQWTRSHQREISAYLGIGSRAAYRQIRNAVKPLLGDRGGMAAEIAGITALISPPRDSAGSPVLIASVEAAVQRDNPAKRLEPLDARSPGSPPRRKL